MNQTMDEHMYSTEDNPTCPACGEVHARGLRDIGLSFYGEMLLLVAFLSAIGVCAILYAVVQVISHLRFTWA